MKLLTAKQIKEWDAFTIRHEPVSSLDLMERAANAFCDEFNRLLKIRFDKSECIKIFCGPGNNGGDGLAIARILLNNGLDVQVYIPLFGQRSADFMQNLERLKNTQRAIILECETPDSFPGIGTTDLIIDALFGTGLNKTPEGIAASCIEHINQHSAITVSVDIPSGLPSELFSSSELKGKSIIRATHTLTFQVPKMSFLFAETFPFVGEFNVLDIGLDPNFPESVPSSRYYVTEKDLAAFLVPRKKFAHKGTFGHAITIGGSYGKIGAPILMSKACLYSGAGMVTAYTPKVGYTIVQTAVPEVMVMTDEELYEIRHFPETKTFDAVGVGPGMGVNDYTFSAFRQWLPSLQKPSVVDADAINLCAKAISENESFHFPKDCILTPHPKEFDRLCGFSADGFERLEKQIHFSEKYNVTTILKGAHTSIVTPKGDIYFNSTGNASMATAGMGDVLTGILTAMLANGLHTTDASLLAVYVHGLCGDHLASVQTPVTASALADRLPFELKNLYNRNINR